jgi:benzil reductase ((S)-benzoin forming)
MFAVNAAAPMYLMGLASGEVSETARLRIVNISSGAAHMPLPGLADYCATKAALRLAGRTLAAELERTGRQPREAAVLSYEPGLVDTAMQEEARGASAEDFPALEAFQRFAAEGQLHAPQDVVGEILVFLDSDPAEGFTERRFGED